MTEADDPTGAGAGAADGAGAIGVVVGSVLWRGMTVTVALGDDAIGNVADDGDGPGAGGRVEAICPVPPKAGC